MHRVSVVIITKNQKKFLENSLPIIKNQTFRDFELLTVDSGSTDGTLELLKKHAVTTISISPTNPKKFNFTLALNEGIKQSQGDLIVHLSGDVVPANEKWLENLIQNFENPHIAAAYSRYMLSKKASLFEKLQCLLLMGEKRRVSTKGTDVLGGSWAFRKLLWERFNPPKELTQCEDAYFMWKAHQNGYLTVYEPTSVVYHTHGKGTLHDIKMWLGQAVIGIKIRVGFYN